MKKLLVLLSLSLMWTLPAHAGQTYNPSIQTFGSLTTTGTSGAATLTAGVLNIPVYSSGGGGAPGGASTNVQFNNSGAFGGDSGFTYGAGAVTIGTSLTSPLIIGGTTTSSTLTLESTSGSGSGDTILLKTGSQTTRATIGTSQISTTLVTGIGTSTLRNGAELDVNGILNVSSQSIGAIGTTPSDSSGTWSTDYSTGNLFTYQLVHGETCVISNPSAGLNATGWSSGILRIKQSATGSDTCTWGTFYSPQGNVAPTLSTAANAIDLISYVAIGTNVVNISLVGTNYPK